MKRLAFLLVLGLLLCGGISPLAAATGKIVGTVKDAESGDPLPGANVILKGSAIGAATNLKGEYRIPRVPPGRYTLVFSYIGYSEQSIEVTVMPDRTTRQDAALRFEAVRGKEVVVTAQMEGQVAAINRQLTSNTIVNVVSADRIQELPDANAAESVGRLPGVSIKRDGGEGNQVVIRGLAPTYNSITIGGERIPATDLDDRSVDLNMIAPEILAGIEVTKALTPDMDADAFGGVVNFKLADAPSGGFRYNFRFRDGYNRQRQEPGQYKGSVTLSDRYLDERLGLMITGNLERAQRGSDRFNSDYEVVREKREGETVAPISATTVNLEYATEVRKRSGFSVLMDYRLPNGKIMFSNFMSRLDRDENITTHRFSEGSNWHELRFRDRQRQIDILSNSLTGEHAYKFANIDWRLSRTASLTRHPFDSRIRSKERGAFDRAKLPDFFGPDDLINSAFNNLDNMSLYQADFYTEKSFERDYSAQLNLKIPYALTSNLAGYVKFGGKYINKSKTRDRGHGVDRLDNTKPGYDTHHTRWGAPNFEYIRLEGTGWPSVRNYLDPGFDAGNFLGGAYEFGPGLDGDELTHLLTSFLLDSTLEMSSLADLDDYEVVEEVSAGYVMTEINLGQSFMFMPGVRYERTQADMTGRKGKVPDASFEPALDSPLVHDTSATATYDAWFPMFHTRLRPTAWFDVRLAYTKSLSRPRLDWMLPKKKIDGSDQAVTFGRPDLKPQISTNYDVFLSFYGNRIGLFTVGGFYKEIRDLIYDRQGHKILNAEKEGFPAELQGLKLNQPENNPFLTKVKGFEVEWQVNFVWLPNPFDGIVLNANYSHIWSETQFPRSFVKQERLNVFPFIKTTVIDTFRVGAMPDQADDIANIAVGYDKGPFSARLSMLYQGKTLSSVGERPELDGFTADLLRWDLSVKYRITDSIGLFVNWNNITDEPDESFQQETRFPTDREFYGWTADLGIGYEF